MSCATRLAQSAIRSRVIKSFIGYRNLSKMSTDLNRVLSIQSHVVHGYCGNKSAVFPLQVDNLQTKPRHVRLTQFFLSFAKLLNFDVDAINSVQLSNHTGYKTIKGQILSEADLADLFDGLTANNLHLTYSHLLTGYVGNDKFLREISRIIKQLREANPNLIYGIIYSLVDPGKFLSQLRK